MKKQIFIRNLRPVKPAAIQHKISGYERAVLRMICGEYTSGEMADRLGITEKRIEKIRSTLMTKTGSRNLAGMVKYAIRKKIYNLR